MIQIPIPCTSEAVNASSVVCAANLLSTLRQLISWTPMIQGGEEPAQPGAVSGIRTEKFGSRSQVLRTGSPVVGTKMESVLGIQCARRFA